MGCGRVERRRVWIVFKGLFINSRVGVGHRGYWTVVKEWVVNGRRRTCRVVESIWQTEIKVVFKNHVFFQP